MALFHQGANYFSVEGFASLAGYGPIVDMSGLRRKKKQRCLISIF